MGTRRMWQRGALAALALLAVAFGPRAFATAAASQGDNEPAIDESWEALDFYQLLQVERSATVAELKRAYRKAALESHPDKFRDAEKKALAQRKFVAVVNAFETLSDAGKRRRYDDYLRSGREGAAAAEWDARAEFYSRMNFGDASARYAHTDFTEEAAELSLWLALVSLLVCVGLPVLLVAGVRKAKPKDIREELANKAQRDQLEAELEREKQRIREEQAARARAQRVVEETARAETERLEAEDRRRAQLAAASRREEATVSSEAESKRAWEAAESSALAKLVARFPGGTKSRWEVITDNLNRQFPSSAPRTVREVTRHAQEIAARANAGAGAGSAPRLPAAARAELPPAAAAAATAAAAAAAAAAPSAPAEDEGADSQWSPEQQLQLEEALKRYPRDTPTEAGADGKPVDRWRLIAAAVSGKTRAQCIARFKHVREQLARRRAAASASST